ncbi:putative RIB4-6,7-dimethyl-8-ribityllumazine synthase [Violaceomyces palustris]|uniref:RIB4-6,7-dimethyl-8-ribityllumazine synthase n=1 Tax=Violaceomyces palustris TaxID=1673888 RepID=A0ACD0P3E1_9BASI|nr:putative RIB4-6,7-dimethyl-8-ribityllumazine synthase [Violaceomyces palustris]
MTSIKGPAPAPTSFPGSEKLRIGIVHARWNSEVIEPLVKGAVESIVKAGVKPENIIIDSVPGSWELPIGTSRMIAGSQIQASSNANDLMGGATSLLDGEASTTTPTTPKKSSGPLDAVISIGVLIKGQTMHFEYIAESCCQGLMRVGLDTSVPVILGVLTVLTEEQALKRAGVGRQDGDKGHNHGEDWGFAAVEMALKTGKWAAGQLE